ncbi:LacI family transcriptional regulator [Dictyobacter alpinus]|uniref:LacI family transcriptional regulator n=1 Tax=Dictyobacter alpinus TaxID=2014873 RepID=A0A402BEA2_9CHLR|nr:LacI family DNA-binding transcriptional regulator [Dictyobacter alpinus]GCE29695.1 LacI family transcriptional regulator [Dictyobacter alpinus]
MSKKEDGSTRRVGLRQVAQRAGVSLSTASNVFADKPGVAISEETRNAVLAAATELKYQPRPRQEIIHRSAVTTLGVVLRKPLPLLTHPFYSYVIHGVQGACEEHNISLMYGRVDEDATTFEALPVMVQREQVQGLLLVGYFADDFYLLLRRQQQPFVMIHHHVDSLRPDSVVCEDERGGYLATQHLIDHGHRQPAPAILTGPEYLFHVRERFAGYRRALAEAGLPYQSSYVRHGDMTVNTGYSEMLALLDLPQPPTAVFCCNDEMAIGAMNAITARGLSVPQDCSIIGFDDIQLARYTTPPLTTIKVEKEWMGAQGLWQLVERITNPDMPSRHTIIGVSLVERESTRSISTDTISSSSHHLLEKPTP